MTTNTLMPTGYTTIFGERENGQKFRPSDWAERLAYCQEPQRWKDYLFVSYRNGVKALVVRNQMAVQCPEKYRHLLLFAQLHQLKVLEHDEPFVPCLC